MKKLIIPGILGLFALLGCSQKAAQKELVKEDCKKQYSYILQNSTKRYLISILVEYTGEKIKVLSNSYALAALLDSLPKDSSRLERIISGQEAIKLNRDQLDEASIIRSWPGIDSITKYGKDSTLNYFFRKTPNRFHQNEAILLTHFEREYLISILADWCLLVSVNDESGYLLVEELNN